MPPLVRPYKGVSPDQRIAARRERLLQALLDVVGQQGVAAASVGAVCTRAELTKRYFYESFDDLDGALAELLAGFHEAVLMNIRHEMATLPNDPRVGAIAMLEQLMSALADPRTARLYAEADGQPTLRALRADAYRVYATEVARVMLGADDTAATLTGLVLVSGITQAAISWLAGEIPMAREEFLTHMAELALGAAGRT